MKTKCMSCGGTTKKMQKGGSTKKKPLLKNPSQGFFKDLDTRIQASLTKMRETPGSAGPFVGDGNQSMLKKEHREMWEQKNLNQDLKLNLYKKQQAKLEKEKKIAEKNKMLKLQNKKGSYSKQGFKVGGMTKMQKGGSTDKTKKYKTKNSYSELTGNSGIPLRTTVSSPDESYKKSIEWQSYLTDTNKPYKMSVTKGGKTNKFQLSKEQALSQRKKVKKTMGFQKGGTVNPVVKKPVVKK